MSKRTFRTGRGKRTAVARFAGWLGGNSVFVVLGLGVIGALIAVGLTAQAARAPSVNGAPNSTGATVWVPLRSTSRADLIAAAQSSPLWHVSRTGSGDYLRDLSHLGTPVLVRGLSLRGSATPPDAYVIPVLDSQGQLTVGAAVLMLNATYTAAHLQSIDTFAAPRPHDTIAIVSAAQATSALGKERQTTLAPGAGPEMVYIAFDTQGVDAGTSTWRYGGEYPDDPLWLMRAANGQSYLVGNNGHVYSPDQVPVAQG